MGIADKNECSGTIVWVDLGSGMMGTSSYWYPLMENFVYIPVGLA